MRRFISGLTSLAMSASFVTGTFLAPLASNAVDVKTAPIASGLINTVQADKVSLKIADITAKKGETVYVPITSASSWVAANPWDSGVMGCDFVITYDSANLTFNGFDGNCAYGSSSLTPNVESLQKWGGQRMAFSNSTEGGINLAINDELLCMIFKVNANAAEKVYTIGWGTNPGNQFTNYKQQQVPVNLIPGSITVGNNANISGVQPNKLNLKIADEKAQKGETVYLPITSASSWVAANPWDSGVMGADFVITYDSTNLTFNGFDGDCAYGGGSITPNAESLQKWGGQRMAFSNSTEGGINLAINDELLCMVFKVNADAAEKVYTIGWGTNPGNKFSNYKQEQIPVNLINGSITVGEPKDDYLLGDINLDGVVDASDASKALEFYAAVSTGVAGYLLTPEQAFNGDVAPDFYVIDASDASAILEYYAYSSTTASPKHPNVYFAEKYGRPE